MHERRLRALVARPLLVALVAYVPVPVAVRAHETDPIYVAVIQWSMPRITASYALSYPELGFGAQRRTLTMRSVGNRLCAVAGAIGFDVDDEYAFDIDEPVTLTLTYAPAFSGWAFTVSWDANGGEGIGNHQVQGGQGFPRAGPPTS